MDATSKKVIQLLESSDLELRMSAIRILTEIGINSAQVIHSLARCLREEPEPLRILALKALARLGARDVAEMVVPMILESGALRDYALQVVTAVGAPAVTQLRSLYGGADFHGKRAVATALSQIGGRPTFEFLLGVLPDEPFELQKHVTRCICESLDAMQQAVQLPLYRPVLRFLTSKKAKADPQVLVAGLIIMGYFHGERLTRTARSMLLSFTDRHRAPEVRRHALVSFQRLLGDAAPSADQVAALEKLLCDEDWHNVAQHALLAFQKVPLPRSRVLKLISLLHKSPHFSVHIHVFERLRGQDSREVARAVIPFLADSRFRVRDAAEVTLRSIPQAIEDLFGVLMESEDSEVCQRVTAILREYPQEVKRRFVDVATHRFVSLFDQNDSRYQFFFDFVQAIDAEPLRQRIYQRARSLKLGRSKDKWVKVGGYLQILWDHHLITPSGRYLFAVALIRQSNKDPSPPTRRANLGLRVIRALIYDDTPGLINSLLKDKDIGPDEIFYIGFHFMEEGEEMRPFAKALLDHLIKKYPKSRFAAPARGKLDLHLTPPKPPPAPSRAAARAAAAAAASSPPATAGAAPGSSAGGEVAAAPAKNPPGAKKGEAAARAGKAAASPPMKPAAKPMVKHGTKPAAKPAAKPPGKPQVHPRRKLPARSGSSHRPAKKAPARKAPARAAAAKSSPRRARARR